MLLDIQIPDAVVRILQDDVVLLQRVGEDVLHLQHLALHVLKDDLTHPVHRPDRPLPAGQRHVGGTAVEEDHIRPGYHIDEHRLHVVQIHLKGRAVHHMDGLIEPPGLGQAAPPQDIHRPHTVVLQQHPFRLVTAVHLLQKFGGQSLLILNGDQTAVALRQELGVVLLLSVLAQEEHRPLAVIEVVHVQRVGEQGGLSGVQKAGDQIERDSGIGHFISPRGS